MIDKNFMAIDLEFNMPSESIIQVGAVVGNLKTGEILDEYCSCIHQAEQLSEFIIKLTGVKQRDIDFGIELDEAYIDLRFLHKKHQCFRNAITWGGGDTEHLRKALGIPEGEYLFGRRWIDAKTLFVSRCFMRGEKHQSGLSKAMARMGLQFQGKKHNAVDDARNTFIIYRELLKEFNNGVEGNEN
jgi:inhibitor of KinA sporulation pathway (predicted exonuclease)